MKALSSGNLLSFHPEHVTICPRLASASVAISSAAASRDTTRIALQLPPQSRPRGLIRFKLLSTLQGIQDRLAEVINFGKAFTGQGGQACKRAGAAKQGEADVQEGRTGRPAAPRA